MQALLNIYSEHVYLPSNRVAAKVLNNFQVIKDFHQHRGAIDGTHICLHPPEVEKCTL